MIYNPLQLLEFCKTLSKQTNTRNMETNTRVILSRAYYSAFLHSREYLKEKYNVRFSGDGSDHVHVERELKACIRQPDNRLFSSIMREMRENRCAADYDLNSPATAISRFSAVSVRKRQLSFDLTTQVNTIQKAEYVTSNLQR
jgi:hypothetical protein